MICRPDTAPAVSLIQAFMLLFQHCPLLQSSATVLPQGKQTGQQLQFQWGIP